MSISKQMAAVGAAILMTICVGSSIAAVGGAAMFNKPGTAPAATTFQSAQPVSAKADEQAQIRQLQDLLSQYQSREQQYQTREQQYGQELSNAQAQILQYQQQLQQIQQLFAALQQQSGPVTMSEGGGD
jgi:uncharacterized protein YlxW (UPF0749 family)